MTTLVQARLINEPFSDPGLFLDFRFGRRALLFDLGDLSRLSSRELLRVSDAFVSHTHMDHFSGFDHLLRLCLHRSRPLRLVGPEGFADRVAAKLAAYTWNLLDERSAGFVVTVDEFDGRIIGSRSFAAREGFQARDLEPAALPPGLVADEDEFMVEAAVFDHGIPCLGFALQERMRLNVRRNGLAESGLAAGPWLNEAKRAVRRGEPDAYAIRPSADRTVTLGEFRRSILRIGTGQRVAYIVDIANHPDNVERAVRLCRRADQLFIETPFLEEDAALAHQRHHLTAAAAGDIARNADVRQIIPLHFSPRYLGRGELLLEQAERSFRKERRTGRREANS